MKGYEVKFNIYANSQGEADAVSQAIISIINDNAKKGVAISAAKITEAFRRWGANPIVRNRITNFFR